MIFWISLVLFISSMLLFYIMLAGWVYFDAKSRNIKALTWTLIVVLIPNLAGLLIYFLVGRRNKSNEMKNKFKKPLFASIVIMIVCSISFISVLINSDKLPIINDVSIGMVNNNIGDKWNISFKTSGEEISRKITLNKNELNNFYVKGSCKEGKVYLLIIQKDKVKLLDLSEFKQTKIDLSKFKQGELRMIIYNEKAKNADIDIKW